MEWRPGRCSEGGTAAPELSRGAHNREAPSPVTVREGTAGSLPPRRWRPRSSRSAPRSPLPVARNGPIGYRGPGPWPQVPATVHSASRAARWPHVARRQLSRRRDCGLGRDARQGVDVVRVRGQIRGNLVVRDRDHEFVERRSVEHHDALRSVRTSPGARHRNGVEAHKPISHTPHAQGDGTHLVKTEFVVDGHGLGHSGEEGQELYRVGECARTPRSREDRSHPVLLALYAVEVSAGEPVAFAHVGEGLVTTEPVSYTHLRAHETRHDLVCRLL